MAYEYVRPVSQEELRVVLQESNVQLSKRLLDVLFGGKTRYWRLWGTYEATRTTTPSTAGPIDVVSSLTTSDDYPFLETGWFLWGILVYGNVVVEETASGQTTRYPCTAILTIFRDSSYQHVVTDRSILFNPPIYYEGVKKFYTCLRAEGVWWYADTEFPAEIRGNGEVVVIVEEA